MIEYRAIGPPGCGKTTWLSKQVANAVAKHGPDSVLLASLTRAAAAELAGRDLPINPESVGTLHAHAFRALGKPALAQDKEHIDAWNAHVSKKEMSNYRLTKTLKADDMGRANSEDTTEGDDLYEQAEIYRHQCIDFELWGNERVRSWFAAWQDYKAMSFAMDFTDMIVKATEVIEHAPGNPRFIFLDEAQDLSLLELRLARKWAAHCEVFIMVGDPDQCLYEWRGSSPLNFENPKLDEEFYKYLSQSYRVPGDVHRIAVSWIENVKKRRVVEYHPRKDKETGEVIKGTVRHLKHISFQDPEALLYDSAHYLDETVPLPDGSTRPKTVMFLGTAGYMLGPIVKTMKEQGLPFHNPYNTKRGDWNPLGAVSRRGSTSMAERIRAFAYGGWLTDARELKLWVETLKLEHFRAGKWVNLEYISRLQGGINMGDISAMLTPEALKRAIATDYEWLRDGMKAQYKDLASTKYAIKVAKTHGETTLGKVPQIIVGTIHSVKGGQADIVYVFPDLSPAADDEWFASGEDAKAGVYRVFYVAMTRARDELVLVDASKSGRAVSFPRML